MTYTSTGSPLYPWLQHPQIQPDTDGKYSGKKKILKFKKAKLEFVKCWQIFTYIYIVFTTIYIVFTLKSILETI